jgi:hypothetical protein
LLQDQIQMVSGLSGIYLSLLPFISGANGDINILHFISHNRFGSFIPHKRS